MSLDGLGSSSLADEHSTQERQSLNLPSSNMTSNMSSSSDPAVPRTIAVPVQQPPIHQVNIQQGAITSVGQPLTRILPPSGPTVTSLPVLTTTANLVAISTDGQASLKQVGVPCTMLPLTSSASMVQGSIARPNTTILPLQTMSPHMSTSYHVPRGPAAVANISAPRSAVATPIIRPALNTQSSAVTAPSLSTSFVPSLRGLTPRALAPATWHGTSSSQAASTPPRGSVFTPGRPAAMTVSARPIGIQVNREPPKQQPNLLSAGQKTIAVQQSTTGTQLQIAEKGFFKSTVSVQSSLGSVTIAQLVPARPQNVTYTSSSLTSSSGPVPFLQTTATTQHITRPILASVQTPVRHGPPALTTPVRLAVATQAVPTSGQGNITAVPVGSRLATLSSAALSTIPSSTVLTSGLARGPVHTRMTLAQTVPRSTSNPTVITTTSSVITNPTRLQVTSPGMLQQGATLLTSQARLTVTSGVPTSALATAGVVSLHPVVVSNTNPSLPAKTTSHPQLVASTNRVISTHQPMGPKVITQSTHGPSIQIAQVPGSFSSKIPQAMHNIVPLQQTAIAITTIPNRSVPYTTSSSMATSNTRPVAMMSAPGKVTEVSIPIHTLQTHQTQQQSTSTNLYIQTSHRASPAPSVAIERPSYSTTYYYETSSGSGYQVSGLSSSIVARPYAPPSAPYTVQNPAITTHGLVTTNQSVRFNPVMVVDQSRSTTLPVQTYMTEGALLQTTTPLSPNSSQMQPVMKLNASPRPSILRKRDNEGSPMKAQRNLGPVLAALGGPPSPSSPRRPDSGGGGNGSSAGSTTISATSSPGLNEVGGDDSQPASIKQEPDEADRPQAPPVEMSPRKKPRKQQLTGNELQEPKFSEDDMEFISDEKISDIKEEHEESEVIKVCFPKRPNISLISSYRHSWKSRHNHFVRYGDVKPKDERRPTVVELASQKQIMQRLNGWKIYHLSTQMEDMGDLETQVADKLTGTLKVVEKRLGKEPDKDMNRINELIKGNIQRSIVIRDQIQEAKSQVMKIFDHKCHVADIISRCANKRSFKKREKS